jgi:hypothetical protein
VRWTPVVVDLNTHVANARGKLNLEKELPCRIVTVIPYANFFPSFKGKQVDLRRCVGGGTVLAAIGYAVTLLFRGRHNVQTEEVMETYSKEDREAWRMPALDELSAPKLTLSKRVWMGGCAATLVALFVVKLVQMTVFK